MFDILNRIKILFSPQNLDDLPWCVVANIVQEKQYGPGGEEKRRGTKHFKPGTKIHIIDWYPGMCEDIIVIGLARKPRRFIKIVIRADGVEKLRVKPIYSPSILKRALDHFNDDMSHLSKEHADNMAKTIPYWQKELRRGRGPGLHI